ncbi:hypothetical protein [Streptomyces sp. S1]|uniref:hypothetical protein n=1 Tax=Streptomyces sp. S1 TaxID=718288 RepID=UPI003D74685D
MNEFRQYFEDNPEIFTALVAAIAIVGGLVGSIIGAKIQANGGRDQAAAAREAAKIAAEAQRVSALWTARQIQLAELLRSANTLIEMCDRMWLDGGEELAGEVTAAGAAVSSRWNEARLIVTENVAQAAGELASVAMAVEGDAQLFAPIMHARNALDRLLSEQVGLAEEVGSILAMNDEGDNRLRALRNVVPSLTEEQLRTVIAYHGVPDGSLREGTRIVRQDFNEALIVLVREAREMLRAQDDVAPAVPEQRRRWWRAAPAVTPLRRPAS